MKQHHQSCYFVRQSLSIVIVALAAQLSLSSSNASEITYFEKSPFTIGAMLNGEEYIVEDIGSQHFDGYDYALPNDYDADRLMLISQGDWDEDGFSEALYMAGNYGNNRLEQYRLISYDPSDGFSTHHFFEDWGNPQLERLRLDGWAEDRWVFTIVSDKEGWTTRDYERVRKRYVIENGKPLLVEELVDMETPVIREIRAYQVETLLYDVLDVGMVQSVDAALLAYDLNNDGQEDQIRGYLWERWGTLRFYVKWADGVQTDTFGQCMRIGVLESVTKGVHDLVCNNSDRYIWNGEKYEERPNKAFEINPIP